MLIFGPYKEKKRKENPTRKGKERIMRKMKRREKTNFLRQLDSLKMIFRENFIIRKPFHGNQTRPMGIGGKLEFWKIIIFCASACLIASKRQQSVWKSYISLYRPTFYFHLIGKCSKWFIRVMTKDRKVLFPKTELLSSFPTYYHIIDKKICRKR